MIEAVGGNSCGQRQTSPTNMEAIKVDYATVTKGNCMSEDDYMGMVTSIIMYTMRKRALMGEPENLRSPCELWLDCRLSFTSLLHVDFMYLDGFPVDEQREPNIDWNVIPKDEIQWATTVSSRIVMRLALQENRWFL